MRPKKHKTTGSNDLFRARLDQIINRKRDFPRTLTPAVLTDGLFSIWLVRQWRLCGS